MGRRHFENGPNFPRKLDTLDPLRAFRDRFYLNNKRIYMSGNSLGLASKDAEETILKTLDQWKQEGIKIWQVDNNKYFLYAVNLAAEMAPLIGVDADEVIVVGCTTTNIHQVISTFYQPTKQKYKILVDDLNFPTDRYAVDSQVRLKGLDPTEAVKVVQSKDGLYISEDAVIEAMTEDVALILLPSVLYRTAQILDMKKITNAAKQRDILIGWDLCHAIGAIEVDMNSIDADFAVWCTYKHLCGGPGAAAGLYINKKHFGRMPGLAGWFGNKTSTQFQLKHEFEPERDASGWQIGTPSLMGMSGLEGALRIFNEAGMPAIRHKSLHLTAYLMYLTDEKLAQYGCKIGNPREDNKRGGHVCLEHDEAYRISLALKERGVIPDFREPNVIRLTPSALYTSYVEVYEVVNIILDIIEKRIYETFSSSRKMVT